MQMKEDATNGTRLDRKDWTILWWNFAGNVVGGLVAGLIVGLVLFYFQRSVTTASLAASLRRDGNAWELRIANQSRVPAFSLAAQIRAAEPIRTHEQTAGVFSMNGRVLGSDVHLDGRSEFLIRCDLMTPQSEYFVRLQFDQPVDKPEVRLSASSGPVNVE